MNYWEFCNNAFNPLSEVEMSSTEETEASDIDVQYWKGLKVRLAVRHLKDGTATIDELHLLMNKRPKTRITNIVYQRALDKEY